MLNENQKQTRKLAAGFSKAQLWYCR